MILHRAHFEASFVESEFRMKLDVDVLYSSIHGIYRLKHFLLKISFNQLLKLFYEHITNEVVNISTLKCGL